MAEETSSPSFINNSSSIPRTVLPPAAPSTDISMINKGETTQNAIGHQGGAANLEKIDGYKRNVSLFGPDRKVLAVASGSPVKQVAGSIAHTSRESQPPVLSAVGSKSVNQAVKAIAIARSYVKANDIDLRVEVMRGPSGGEIKDLVYFVLKATTIDPLIDEKEYQNLKSSGKSGPSALAGAIANNIRDGKNVRITAVGQNPVFRAVDSIVFARKYLTNDVLDVDFQPQFTRVTFSNGTEGNALMFTLISRCRDAATTIVNTDK